MGIIYFTEVNETEFDQNLVLSTAKLLLKIILENIKWSKFSLRKPYNFPQQWQDLSHTRWQQLPGFKMLHQTDTGFALSRTICNRATISQWPFHTLDMNPWRQHQEFSWKLSSTNTAFCCHSRYKASIFFAADKGWENKSCPIIIFILWGKLKKYPNVFIHI